MVTVSDDWQPASTHLPKPRRRSYLNCAFAQCRAVFAKQLQCPHAAAGAALALQPRYVKALYRRAQPSSVATTQLDITALRLLAGARGERAAV
eukprot:6172560-Pleurochrysis_carterae.AAC.6